MGPSTTIAFTAAMLLGIVADAPGEWQRQAVETDADFRGLCVVGPKVAWVGGTKGTFGRTADAGKTWTVGRVPGAETLDFRAVVAFGEGTAHLMSAGPGSASRIFKTTDGGKTWALRFTNSEASAFFDALAFWDEKNGIALSDPVGGRFLLIVTDDGGETWKRLPEKDLPKSSPKEGVFAASGTCLVAHGKADVWFCTGGAKKARVFHSADRGRHWTAAETPITAGVESAGVFSIAFRDRDRGLIVGGDYRKPRDIGGVNAAVTGDGGKTWTAVGKSLTYRSCVAWAKDRWVAVGTSGSDSSLDGTAWKSLDRENYNSVGFAPTGEGWAVGPKGRIARFSK